MDPIVFKQHSDLESRHWWFHARRTIVSAFVKVLMAGHEDELIVDVGCGTGGTVEGLRGHYNCVGIDASAEAIGHAPSPGTSSSKPACSLTAYKGCP